MKITINRVKRLYLSELKNLDPIGVILTDYAPRQGKIATECFGGAWSSYWEGMGDKSIAEFVIDCDNPYLINNLSNLEPTVTDEEGFENWLRSTVIQSRKNREICHKEARYLWGECYNTGGLSMEDISGIAHRVVGDGWYELLPTKPNPEYEYLERIVNAVRDGLKETIRLETGLK